jgi:hypothetical protein
MYRPKYFIRNDHVSRETSPDMKLNNILIEKTLPPIWLYYIMKETLSGSAP